MLNISGAVRVAYFLVVVIVILWLVAGGSKDMFDLDGAVSV